MSEHRYDIRISESCVDPNPLRVEKQDPDNFPRLQTRERCALEIAAYVFKKVEYNIDIMRWSVAMSVCQSEMPRPIPRNSVESDHGCTWRLDLL